MSVQGWRYLRVLCLGVFSTEHYVRTSDQNSQLLSSHCGKPRYDSRFLCQSLVYCHIHTFPDMIQVLHIGEDATLPGYIKGSLLPLFSSFSSSATPCTSILHHALQSTSILCYYIYLIKHTHSTLLLPRHIYPTLLRFTKHTHPILRLTKEWGCTCYTFLSIYILHHTLQSTSILHYTLQKSETLHYYTLLGTYILHYALQSISTLHYTLKKSESLHLALQKS